MRVLFVPMRRSQHAVDALLIVKCMLGGCEGAELVDVGARSERLVAGALKHQHLDRMILVGLFANLGEPLVHRERESIACLRAVECDLSDAVLEVIKDVFGSRGLLVHASPLLGNFVLEGPP
jgi:hypothetical protein